MWVVLVSAACSGAPEERPAPEADSTGAPAAQAPREPVVATPEDSAADHGNAQWTVAMTAVERNVSGAAILRAVRTARHSDYDRIVFDFGSDPIPNYTIEYVDRPVHQCGSGDVVPLAGDAWLHIRLNPAHAHTDDGQPTVRQRDMTLTLPNLQELKLICDFEAYVEWVAALAVPMGYRAFELRAPARLVVDVSHGRR